MKKQTKLKDTMENYELFPSVGGVNSQHTYTPESHENLLRSYSKVKVRDSGSKTYKQENKKLKAELQRLHEQLRQNQEEIQLLKRQQANVNEDIPNKTDDIIDWNETESVCSILNTRETLSRHFHEMMKRFHNTLTAKNRQIKSLQERLEQYEGRHGRQEEQMWSQEFRAHPSVEAERLRRTQAAIRVFRRDMDLVRTQLDNSPLDEQRFPRASSRDRVVLAELRRRQRFGVVADLEAMGNKFFQRLEFEERLDKLHWELETRRHAEHMKSSGGECAPTCTHHQEFQLLEATRNNLLKALSDLRAASTYQQPRPPLGDPISINTLQTLYKASKYVAQSYVSVRDTTSDVPDK